ncbi:DUF2318 domain-containing protein [Deferribacter autotrophicus]|uniref:DUF2318 domain-containing protein n=1 Tax=Deferribacter autotrophicus TaxID=500465 RepID=A0A5A8F4Z6_9BACT|nr:DUF2318 domain-containing protein [Deferribacter autotrophicus]KAA0256888.1 DUF2318 domain-containing protein [Deferribacter autotrophicus]
MLKIRNLVLSLLVLFILISCGGGKYKNVTAENGIVKIPVNEVNDGKIHYYVYKTPNKEIKFFILADNHGTIRAAFDACDVCYPEKKGYRQEGDFVICNNCGQRFHESKINEVKGGCNPAPLKRNYDKNFIYIKVNDILQGSFYF